MARNAVITGGGSGIGKAIGRRLVADGFHCILVGRNLDRLEKTVAELDEERPDPRKRSSRSPVTSLSPKKSKT